MKIINSSIPTAANNLAQPWTAPTIAFTYQCVKELSTFLANSIITNITGAGISLTMPYVLYGVNIQATYAGGVATLTIGSGAILYNNEVYFVNATSFTYASTLNVRIFANLQVTNSPVWGDPIVFNDNVARNINNDRTIAPAILTSGSGIPALPGTAFFDMGSISAGGPVAGVMTYLTTVPSQIQTSATNTETAVLSLINLIGNTNGGFLYPAYGQAWNSIPVYATGWADGSPAIRYTKEYWTGRVNLNGTTRTVAGFSSGITLTIFTLPVGFRPTILCQFFIPALSASGTWYSQLIVVQTSGAVQCIGNALPTAINFAMDLSPISFQAW